MNQLKRELALLSHSLLQKSLFFGGVNTNYSSAAQLFNSTGISIIETGDFVTVDELDLLVMTEQTSFSADNISFRD